MNTYFVVLPKPWPNKRIKADSAKISNGVLCFVHNNESVAVFKEWLHFYNEATEHLIETI